MKNLSIILLMTAALTACGHMKDQKLGSKQADKEHIKSFAGCYQVSFNFAETFPVNSDYKIKKPQRTGALELVVVDEESENHIELQHVLIVGGEKAPRPLKHWRQDWIYEPTESFEFKGHNQWQRQDLSGRDTKGMWLQRVSQVDDAPRYECVAPWVNNGVSDYWECRSWTPLPRREYTTRNDYQVLNRLNRQRLTDYGWIHEQDGEKLKTEFGGKNPTAIVNERGENTYKRIDTEACKLAQDWWNERKGNWKTIRTSWKQVKTAHPTMQLNFKDAEGDLWKKLFELDDKAASEKWEQQKLASESKAMIESYLKVN